MAKQDKNVSAPAVKKTTSNGRVVVKRVTQMLLKLTDNTPVAVKILDAVFVGKALKNAREVDKKPANLVNVIDLDTGAEMQLIVASMMQSTLEDEYPNNGYVGKCFEITKLGKVLGGTGNSYNKYSIIEIEEPGAE